MAQASTSKTVDETNQNLTPPNSTSQLFASALSDLQTFAPWDPQKSEDWNQQAVERASLLRIKR